MPLALVDGLTDAALALNIREAGDDRRADLRAFSDAVRQGEVSLCLSGPARELGVCELYLAVEFDLSCGNANGQVQLEADQDGGHCVYENMGIPLSLRPIERMAEDEALYRELMENTGGAEISTDVKREDNVAWQELIDTGRIRMGVLGDTGMGKSTFINGVLRRPGLLPEDVDVCTGVIIELQYVPARDEECFEVHLLTRDERDDVCRAACEEAQLLLAQGGSGHELQELLRGKFWSRYVTRKKLTQTVKEEVKRTFGGAETYLSWTDRQNEHAGFLRAIQAAAEEASRMESTGGTCVIDDLSRLPDYVRAKQPDQHGGQQPNGWPLLTSSLTVSLHAPLLENVTLVDTPGLRDVDDRRAERTRNVLTRLNGWVYLVDAEPKSGQPRLDGIRAMRDRVHIPHGVIAANKMDMLVAQARGRSVDDLFAERRQYLEGEGCPVVTCSARAASFLPERRPSPDEVIRLAEGEWIAESWGWPLIRGRVPLAPVERRTKVIRRRAEDLVDDRISTDERVWRSLVDFQLDSSELVNVVRELCRVLEEQVIAYLVMQHRQELAGNVENHRRNIESELESITRQLNADDKRKELTDLFSERDTDREQLREKKSAYKKEIEVAKVRTSRSRRDCVSSAKDHSDKLFLELPSKVETEMDEAAEWQLRGHADFSIHDLYTAPLATEAGSLVGDFAIEAEAIWSDISFLSADEVAPIVTGRTQNFNLEDTFSSVKVFESLWERFSTTKERGVGRAKKTAQAIQCLLIGNKASIAKLKTESIRSGDVGEVPGLKKALEESKGAREGRLPERLTHIVRGLSDLAQRELKRLDSQIEGKTKEIGRLKKQIEDAKKDVHKSRAALELEQKDRRARMARLDQFLEHLGYPHLEPNEPETSDPE